MNKLFLALLSRSRRELDTSRVVPYNCHAHGICRSTYMSKKSAISKYGYLVR